jgi:hypothetical protein
MNWKPLLQSLIKVAAKNDVRYYLNGIHIYRDGVDTVFEATDGYMALIVRCNIADAFPQTERLLFARSSIESAIKLGAGPIEFDGGSWQCAGVKLEKIDGRFPDAERALNIGSKGVAIEKGVSIDLQVKMSQAISILMKGFGSKFMIAKVTQTSADAPFITHGGEGVMTFKCGLMPARI